MNPKRVVDDRCGRKVWRLPWKTRLLQMSPPPPPPQIAPESPTTQCMSSTRNQTSELDKLINPTIHIRGLTLSHDKTSNLHRIETQRNPERKRKKKT